VATRTECSVLSAKDVVLIIRKAQLERLILPLLESPPEIMGLTFGVETGELMRLVMMDRREYIGRAINVACRLQGAIKDKDKHPEYKVLVSNQVFQKLSLANLANFKPVRVVRTLRNIRDGKEYLCVKLRLQIRQ
jgi:class 3 adenylate cyclase